MRLPRKTKKIVSEALRNRWPRAGSRSHQRLQRFCRHVLWHLDSRMARTLALAPPRHGKLTEEGH